MKKLALLLTLILSFTCFAGCDGDSGGETPGDEYTVTHVIRDEKYEQGFKLKGLNSATDSGVVKVINYGDSSLAPKWTLAQWWSKYNLKDGSETITTNSYSLTDRSKNVKVNRKYGTLTLGVTASEEFEHSNAGAPPSWPHLLLEQSFPEGMRIRNADKIDVTLDFTLTKAEDKRIGSGLHAQFAWFIYVVDKNPDSPGFGNFLWFGLNIYNSKQVYAPGTSMQDTAGGPGNWIYTVGASEFLTDKVKVNQNINTVIDIKPHISKAIAAAQAKGFMQGTTVDDCNITGMNIGWEVFDRWDVEVDIFNLGIDIKTKK